MKEFICDDCGYVYPRITQVYMGNGKVICHYCYTGTERPAEMPSVVMEASLCPPKVEVKKAKKQKKKKAK